MKTKILFFISTLFCCIIYTFCYSQNLIVNPSFELATPAYSTAIVPAAWPSLRGLWKFDNTASPLVATVGTNLTLAGTHTTIAGYSGTDNAVRIGPGSNYSVLHGMPGNGGSATLVNQYTILVDFRVASLGSWKTFYQTNNTNSNDADLWVRDSDGMIGVGAAGYSIEGAIPNVWHRMILSVNNGSFFKIYLDGRVILNGTIQAVNGRFSLDPRTYFMSDDNGEDGLIDVSTIALFNSALTQTEVESLGRWTCNNWIGMGNYQQRVRNGGYPSAFAGTYYLYAGSETNSDAYQDVNVSGDAVAIDAGLGTYAFSGRIQTYNQNPQDQGQIIVEYRNSLGTVLSSYNTGLQTTASAWINFSDTRTAPGLTRTIRIRLISKKNNGTSNDAYYDDFSLTKLFILSINDIDLKDLIVDNSECKLNWVYSGSESLENFEIERSQDFVSWESIRSIKFASDEKKYSDTDFLTTGNTYYYRIKGNTINQKTLYSKIKSINGNNVSDFYLHLAFENPINVNEEFNIVANQLNCDLLIYDLGGKVIYESKSNPTNNFTYQFNSPGIYILKVIHQNKIITKKVIVR